ncbi:hypothetical protein Ddc_10651 [Ditylenchus destructor]|nr:hypothetical protein Ddc_10651 [Ditylenchus destructor]
MAKGAPLEPEMFVEDPRLHNKCGYHVQILYYGHCVVTVAVDFLGVVVGILVFLYPQKLRETSIYRQLFQHYDRTQAYHYQLFYNLSAFGWIFLFFFHILSIGLSILGVQKQKPWLILPQLILLLIRIGLLLALFAALVTINITGEELMLKSVFLVFFFLIFGISFLVATVFCFRYVLERPGTKLLPGTGRLLRFQVLIQPTLALQGSPLPPTRRNFCLRCPKAEFLHINCKVQRCQMLFADIPRRPERPGWKMSPTLPRHIQNPDIVSGFQTRALARVQSRHWDVSQRIFNAELDQCFQKCINFYDKPRHGQEFRRIEHGCDLTPLLPEFPLIIPDN